MREVGVVDRISKKYGMKTNELEIFKDHYNDKHNFQDEGVMFDPITLKGPKNLII